MSDTAKRLARSIDIDRESGSLLEPGRFRQVLQVLTDEGTDGQKAVFLRRLRGHETAAMVTEAARFLREHPDMVRVAAPAGAIDIVGTGGDAAATPGGGSFNVSTAAAFVAAGAGAKVAKHGNRAVSSRSGASDVLSALGVKLDVPRDVIERAIVEAGVGFLWAPQHHPAMKTWAKVRAELGLRTIFNLLGPLSNPALVKRQVIGVYAREWVRPVAEVMRELGSEHVWVVHGSDGLDELTTTGASFVAELHGGAIAEFEVRPDMAGLPTAKPADLHGGDPAENAALMRAVLGGDRAQRPGLRDIVVLNAASALVVAEMAVDLRAGAHLAAQSIDSGAAKAALDRLIAITNGAA